MSKPVHIVRTAARTPVGLSAVGTAAAVRAGISRLAFHPFIIDRSGNPMRCGIDGELPHELSGVQRVEALAGAALDELLAQPVTRGTIPLLLALPEPRPGFSKADAQAVLRGLAARAYAGAAELSPRAAAVGHAGALRAIAEAVAGIRGGQYQLCAVGGVDSYLDGDTVEWLDDQLLLAREDVRGGFPPGESAAFVLLASDDARKALSLPSLAQVVAVEHVEETRKRDSDEGFLGEALTRAITGVASTLQLPKELISDVYCDINGERMRTDDWGFALLRTQQFFRDASSYHTAIAELGEIGAAWGALNAVLAVEAFRGGYGAGPLALLWGSSWSGSRAACLLRHAGST